MICSGQISNLDVHLSDKNKLLSCSEDCKARIWDLETAKVVSGIKVEQPVGAGRILQKTVYLGVDSKLQIFDLREKRLVYTEPVATINASDEINCIDYRDYFIAFCDDSGQVQVADSRNMKCSVFKEKHENIASSIVFGGPWTIWSAGLDQTIRKWDFSTNSLLETLDLSGQGSGNINPPFAHSIQFNGNVHSGLADGRIAVYNSLKRKLEFLNGHTWTVNKLCNHGNRLVSAGADGKIIEWTRGIPKEYSTTVKISSFAISNNNVYYCGPEKETGIDAYKINAINISQ